MFTATAIKSVLAMLPSTRWLIEKCFRNKKHAKNNRKFPELKPKHLTLMRHQILFKYTNTATLSKKWLHTRNQDINQIGKFRKLIKPFLFTTAASGGAFVIATIAQYESNHNFKRPQYVGPSSWQRNSESSWRDQIKKQWKNTRDSMKIFWAITAINGLVFICWRVPRFQPIMFKYFISRIGKDSIPILPMVLSNYSHYSLTHLGMNMFVLYSFCNLAVHLFGPENFIALYFSSGIVSSFVSCFYRVTLNLFAPSLGASGAILGILGACCLERPDIQLMIIFLPFFKFSSYTALKSLLLLDTLGVVLRWEFFDHAAHLGGTLFGMYYSNSLKDFMMEKRSSTLENWKNFKGKF